MKVKCLFGVYFTLAFQNKEQAMTKTTKLRLIGGLVLLFNLWAIGNYNLTGIPVLLATFGFAAGYEYLIVRPVSKATEKEFTTTEQNGPQQNYQPTQTRQVTKTSTTFNIISHVAIYGLLITFYLGEPILSILNYFSLLRTAYPMKDMDWDNNGLTSISEFIDSRNIRKEEFEKDGNTCTKYFKNELGIKIVYSLWK